MKPSIKKMMVAAVGLTAAAGMAQAALLSNSFSGSEAIPDGNPVGVANGLGISDIGGAAIQDVSVTLNLSGGYNGDLYGYLVFQPTGGGTASMDVLLNQIGTSPGNPFGSATAGFDAVNLSDSGSSGIHSATGTDGQQVATGTYTPDDGGQGLDNTFKNQSADGTWTLFLADMSAGGGTSVLNGWSIDISVVPEPVTWAIGLFAILMATFHLIYRFELKAPRAQGPANRPDGEKAGELLQGGNDNAVE